MARPLRAVSETGIYHVMARGNRRKIIFHNAEDKQRFINIILNKNKDQEFSLLAYCIMDNHYHLLIKEEKEDLGTIIRILNSSYAMYYNNKYEGVGHVFQGRYKSEPVNNDAYLLGATRYIHNNPIKAGMEKRCQDYPWSSYQQYIYYRKDNELVNVSFILGLFSKNLKEAITKFSKFNQQDNNDIYIDDYCEKEEENKVREYITLILNENNINIDQLINDREYLELRNKTIKEVMFTSLLSITKLAKVIGINRNTLMRNK